MTTTRKSIIEAIKETAEVREAQLVQDLCDQTILLESGIDSLGFAILVARLEEELGYDPFLLMTEPVYPRTLGEFIEIYERFAQK